MVFKRMDFAGTSKVVPSSKSIDEVARSASMFMETPKLGQQKIFSSHLSNGLNQHLDRTIR